MRVANAGATDALGIGLKTFLESDTVKASFLILSRPEDMDNVVDNLQTKMNITYDNVYIRRGHIVTLIRTRHTVTLSLVLLP